MASVRTRFNFTIEAVEARCLCFDLSIESFEFYVFVGSWLVK